MGAPFARVEGPSPQFRRSGLASSLPSQKHLSFQRRQAAVKALPNAPQLDALREPSTHAGRARQSVVHVIEHSVHVGDVRRARRLQSLE